jgi:Leucine-rich repeat (LRR) protein
MHTLDQLRAGHLHGLKRLDLSANLTEFPREIFALADTLEVLNLTGNALSALPDDLPRLHKLQVLFCSDNQFTEVPAVLGQCPQLSMVGFKANRIRTLPGAALPPQLRWLILTDNQLEELPTEIGHCPQLQKLMLAGNQLTELPEKLANCTKLELLRIAANRLSELPAWLLAMPRLSWLAYAGNPFAGAAEATALARNPIQTIDWADLSIEQQ